MAGAAEILVRVIGESSGAVRAIEAVETRTSKFNRTVQKLQGPAKVAAGAVVGLGVVAGKAASDLQQSSGAVESVFGKYAAGVKAQAAQAATNVGLAKNQYQELASVIGSQLKNMGVPMGEVAGQTDELITLGADLAATYGGSTSEAVEALSSLMRGERDPIERYGVSINDAAIKAELAARGQDKLTGAAAKAAQTQATLALLAKQTGDAQGQFARESDSAAGSLQIAKAQATDAAAQLGTALLPAVAAVAGKLAELAQWAQQNAGLVQALGAAILIASGIIMGLRAAMVVATVAQWAWNVAVSANPIGLIILAIIALIAVIVLVVKNWDKIKRVALVVWNAVKLAVAAAAAWMRAKLLQAGAAVVGVWNRIKATNAALWSAVRNLVSSAISAYIRTVQRIISAASSVMSRVRGYFSSGWSSIRTSASNAVSSITGYLSRIVTRASSVVSRVRSGIGGAFSYVRGLASSLFSTITNGVSSALGWISSLISRVRGLFSMGVPSWVSAISGLFTADQVGTTVMPYYTGAQTFAAGDRMASWLGGNARRSTSSGPVVVNINVSGALDPSAVAQQLRRILNSDAQIRGAVPLGGVVVR